ncbi:MAG: hypothetical protein LIP12_10805 [Clostridiales bacterium]|nr:hypothetical protein [Clostridiales bacterium]
MEKKLFTVRVRIDLEKNYKELEYQVREGILTEQFLQMLIDDGGRTGMDGKPYIYMLNLSNGFRFFEEDVLDASVLQGTPVFVVSENMPSKPEEVLYGCPTAKELVGVVPECMLERGNELVEVEYD